MAERLATRRLSGAILAIAAAIAAAHFVFAVQLHRHFVLAVLPLALSLVLLASLRLRPVLRARVALAAALLLAACYAVEIRAGRAEPRDGTAAARRGERFDTRGRWEVIRDHRRAGRDAVPSVQPRELLTQSLAAEPGAPEAASDRPGVDVGGAATLPLGGISSRLTVFCNEGGAYAEYDSDERGFANPRGIWASGRIDIGVVGEAFAQGACVARGAGAIDRIRALHPATLSLAMAGNGPLLQLAGIEEYLADLKPKTVLWFHYGKDLATLDVEKASPLLRRYLENGYRQNLAAKQAQIDQGIAALLKQPEARAATWPSPLASLGLTRGSTPMWLQDLVMAEQHSSAAVALRLDRLNGAVEARLSRERGGPPPDFALYRAILAKAKATVASWGGTLTFVYLADVHNLRGKEHPSRKPVLDAVSEAALPLIDLQPVFAAVPDPMTLRYHEQSHYNENGYRLVAETVLAALEKAR